MAARRQFIRAALFGAGIGYWSAAAAADQVAEPWDGARYWTLWYPLSLLFCAAAGAWIMRRGWQAGATIILAQLVLLILRAESWSLLPFGFAIAFALTLPAMLIAELAARLRSKVKAR